MMTPTKRLLAFWLAWVALAASATEFDHLAVGQEVTDKVVGVGRFRIQLPAYGAWTVVSKQSVQAGRDAASWNQPIRQTIAVAQSTGSALSAVFIFTAPAKPYKGGARWNDDPCALVTDFITKDTMNQTYMMPECFVVQRYRKDMFNPAAGGTFPDIVNWASSLRLSWPEHFVRVYYTKYSRSGYLRGNLYLAGSPESLPWVESWGRQLAASMAAAVRQGSGSATVPAVPALPNAPVAADGQRETLVSPTVAKSAESRMLELKSLLDKGLITGDDYNEKRKKILQDL